jgi:16S rRNA (uracil1498-N3)-methyltransferase
MIKSKIILPEPVQLDRDYEVSGEPFQALQHWQPRRGEIITVQDTDRQYFRARIKELSPEGAVIHAFERRELSSGAELEIMLHQALPEKERMEWIIQKTTELGVHAIIPFQSQRAISLEERERKQKKAARWPFIALRAAKQCRRPAIPHIFPFCTFRESLQLARQSQIRILLWEKQQAVQDVNDFLNQNRGARRISFMVGPEGGFTEQEVSLAVQAGFTPLRLGPRILRTETASLVILSILQFTLGDLR